MKEKIDCLLVGPYDTPTEEMYDTLSLVKDYSCTYRDFNLGFIKYENSPYTITQLYNMFQNKEDKKNYKKNIMSCTISYLASYLNNNQLSFKYILYVNEELNKLIYYLQNYEILTVAITTTYYVYSSPIEYIINLIRNYNRDTKIVVGGPYIESLSRTIKNKSEFEDVLIDLNADFYINSICGEKSLIQLISNIKNKMNLDQIPNLFYKGSNGLLSTFDAPEQNILEENLIDWKLFRDDPKKYIYYRTATSCPFSCSFCGFPQRAGKYRTLDVELIEQQLDTLILNNSQLERIYFVDDTFNVPPERFKEILRMMIKKRYNFKWHSYYRCQYTDSEVIELMRESGCEGVFLGIESGSDRILKNMNKKSSTKDFLNGIELLKKAGIITLGSFLTGFPGETSESINETINFIEKSGLDFFRTQLWFYDHITPIWEQRADYKIEGLGFSWQHNTMDSKIASDYVDKIYLNIKNSIWLPQYDFDWIFVWNLKSVGYEMNQIKAIVSAYNDMIKEKLANPSIENCSPNLISKFKIALDS